MVNVSHCFPGQCPHSKIDSSICFINIKKNQAKHKKLKHFFVLTIIYPDNFVTVINIVTEYILIIFTDKVD